MIDLPQPLVVVAGPTAAGKTAVAIELASIIGGEIVSADSMQVYRHLSIGTAKPVPEELKGIPYHLVDFVEPDYQYNLGDYVADADRVISEIRARGRRPILCGGTGLYIRGVLQGIFDVPSRDPEVRARLHQAVAEGRLAELHAELREVDPGAHHIMPGDAQRIVRALEVFHVTGTPISELQRQQEAPPRHGNLFFVISIPRGDLYARIEQRVDHMLLAGLVEEVRHCLRMGFTESHPAFRALGYGEIVRHLRGDVSLEDAGTEIKRRTRHYAKRQLTWFRAVRQAEWLECGEMEPWDVAQVIKKRLALNVAC